MKRTVIFYMSYRCADIAGHRMSSKNYSIFTRNSVIVNDSFNWSIQEQEDITDSQQQEVFISNLKIIGL